MAVFLGVIADLAEALNEGALDRKWVIFVGFVLILWWGRPKKFAKAFSAFSGIVILIMLLLDEFISSVSKDDQSDEDV